MSSQRAYGAPVDTDEFSSPLEPTRRLRLALNVLCDDLPNEMQTRAVHDMLRSIHDQINTAEAKELRMWGLAEHYLIIRPISPMSPPPPETMQKIAAAVRTLAELGMLAGQNDAYDREP